VSGEPHIRKVRPDDLEEVWRVHVASSNDLLFPLGAHPLLDLLDELLRADADEAELAVPGILAVVEEGQE
jgi:hypothetical protein